MYLLRREFRQPIRQFNKILPEIVAFDVHALSNVDFYDLFVIFVYTTEKKNRFISKPLSYTHFCR